jgi:hypothetical protein
MVLVGHRSLKAALDLDWGQPKARAQALRLVLEEVDRWKSWLEQHQRLLTELPPLKAVMDTLTQIATQDTEPDPTGGPGGQRIKKHVAPDRRISIEDAAMRHGRKSSAKTFNGFKEHFVLDLDSHTTREVVVRPANEPEHAVVALVAAVLEHKPGLLQLDIDLGYMASPQIALGTGTLGEQTRVTIRIPTALYERLEAYADGRSFVRGGTPMFAACIREAIEHYLACPQKRQTRPQAEAVTAPSAPQPTPRRRKRQAAPAD